MIRSLTTISLLVICPFGASGQVINSEVKSALADAEKLPQEQAYQTRYLTIYPIELEKRLEYLKILNVWVHSLSSESEFYKLRRVSNTVYAIEIDNYGWKQETWEKLAEIEPYFHVRVKVLTNQESPKIYYRGGTDYKPGWYKQVQLKEVILTALSPWLEQESAQKLSVLTNSGVPIIRADWFLFQSGEQANRKVGYYDFLNLKTLKDVEKLAGLDVKLAQSARKEIAAIITESAVAVNNRQIFRFGAIGGSYWETRDVNSSVDVKNAVRNLDGDFKADAKEIYYNLPNGLWGFVLVNAKDELQSVAPPDIASDSESRTPNRQVRVGVSCTRCHIEGLRSIDDFGRKLFRAENSIGLGSPDRDKYRRLKQLYLGPLQRELTNDRARYAAVLNDLCGLKPEVYAKTFASYWAQYESGPIFPDDAERELGIPKKVFIEKLTEYLHNQKVIDPVIASFLANPPLNMRREHWDEQIPVIMNILGYPK